MNSTQHILSKEGILTTFSIAKKVSKKDIFNFQKQLALSRSKNSKLGKLLAKKMIEETRKALSDNKIPGLIISGQNISDEEKRKMMELTYFASIVAKKISEKKIDKYYMCYIVNAIVNMIGLDEKSFDDFHKKFSKFKNNENNDSEENSSDII